MGEQAKIISDLKNQLNQITNDMKIAVKEKEDFRSKYEEQLKIVKQHELTMQTKKEEFKREMKELKNKFKALKEDYTKKNDENERNL